MQKWMPKVALALDCSTEVLSLALHSPSGVRACNAVGGGQTSQSMLREIDSRVRFLTKRLESLKVVSDKPSDPNKVYFGAWVTIEDEDGKQARYRIVGPDELDLKQGLISIDSPLARALIGKALDAEVQVQTPTGEQWVYIVAIDYP